MGKKMKFPSLFKPPPEATATTTTTITSWPWPSCGNPKTLSFRATAGGGNFFKTINSGYDAEEEAGSLAAEVEDSGGGGSGSGGESVEAVIRRLREAERLFCEPGETSSILGGVPGEANAKNDDDEGHLGPTKDGRRSSVSVVAMDSMDPYVDFKRSMEEMVEAHGLKKDWDGLEELLGWYLRANGKETHGYIVGAFVDLLVVDLAFGFDHDHQSSSCGDDDHDIVPSSSFVTTTTTTTSSSANSFSLNSPLLMSFSSSSITSSSTSSAITPCLSSFEAEDEIVKTVDSGC